MLPFASLACFVDDADVMCVEVVQLVELVRGQAYDEQRNTAMSSCAGKPTVRRAGEQRDHARVATNSMPSAHRRVRCTPVGLRVGERAESRKCPRHAFILPLPRVPVAAIVPPTRENSLPYLNAHAEGRATTVTNARTFTQGNGMCSLGVCGRWGAVSC